MSDLLTGLALAIAIEGTLYALFPDGMKRMMAVLQSQPPGRLRNAGLVMAATGVGIVWLVRG